MVTIYYDGICKLCSKEIDYYKKRVAPSAVTWIDIARNGNALKNYGISQAEALLHMHAIDGNGKVLVGVDAFIALWKQLPYWRVLAQIVSVKPVKFIATLAYSYFAKQRFKTSDHCKFYNKIDKSNSNHTR